MGGGSTPPRMKRSAARRASYEPPLASAVMSSRISWLVIAPTSSRDSRVMTGSTVRELYVIRCRASSTRSSGHVFGVDFRATVPSRVSDHECLGT